MSKKYTKEEFLKAAEIGEVSMIDAGHIVSLLDEARRILSENDWEMFKVFAKLHPVEAYDSRPDDFCRFMRGQGYDLNNAQIKELIDSSR